MADFSGKSFSLKCLNTGEYKNIENKFVVSCDVATGYCLVTNEEGKVVSQFNINVHKGKEIIEIDLTKTL